MHAPLPSPEPVFGMPTTPSILNSCRCLSFTHCTVLHTPVCASSTTLSYLEAVTSYSYLYPLLNMVLTHGIYSVKEYNRACLTVNCEHHTTMLYAIPVSLVKLVFSKLKGVQYQHFRSVYRVLSIESTLHQRSVQIILEKDVKISVQHPNFCFFFSCFLVWPVRMPSVVWLVNLKWLLMILTSYVHPLCNPLPLNMNWI